MNVTLNKVLQNSVFKIQETKCIGYYSTLQIITSQVSRSRPDENQPIK